MSYRIVLQACLRLFLREHMGIDYPQSSLFLYYGKKCIHKIYHLNHSSVHSAVVLTTCTWWYSKSLELFSSCKTETLYHVTINSPPSSSQALATTILPSKSLTILGISDKQNHAAFISLRLAYLTQYNVLKVHPCGNTCQDFLLFKAE